MQNLKYTDASGVEHNVELDLSKGIEVTGITAGLSWDLGLQLATATEMVHEPHVGTHPEDRK